MSPSLVLAQRMTEKTNKRLVIKVQERQEVEQLQECLPLHSNNIKCRNNYFGKLQFCAISKKYQLKFS